MYRSLGCPQRTVVLLFEYLVIMAVAVTAALLVIFGRSRFSVITEWVNHG